MGGFKQISLNNDSPNICPVTFEPVVSGVFFDSGIGEKWTLSTDGLECCKIELDFKIGWTSAELIWPTNRQSVKLTVLKRVLDGKLSEEKLNESDIKALILNYFKRVLSMDAEAEFYRETLGDPIKFDPHTGRWEFVNETPSLDRAARADMDDFEGFPLAILEKAGIWCARHDVQGKAVGEIKIKDLYPELVDLILSVIDRLAGENAILGYITRLTVIGVSIESCGLSEVPKALFENHFIRESLETLNLSNNELKSSNLFGGYRFPNLRRLIADGNSNISLDALVLTGTLRLCQVSYYQTMTREFRLARSGNNIGRHILHNTKTGFYIDSVGRFIAIANVDQFESDWLPKYVYPRQQDLFSSVRLIVPNLEPMDDDDWVSAEYDYSFDESTKNYICSRAILLSQL